MSNITTLTKIESSMVYALGFDEKQQILEVVFTKGGIWEYHGFPKDEYDHLINSRSIGSYMRNCVIGFYDEMQIS